MYTIYKVEFNSYSECLECLGYSELDIERKGSIGVLLLNRFGKLSDNQIKAKLTAYRDEYRAENKGKKVKPVIEEEKIKRYKDPTPVVTSFKPEVRIQVDEGGYMPVRAHRNDAGLDLYAPEGLVIDQGVVLIDLKVHILIPVGHVGLLTGRSSFSASGANVLLGVIDAGYTGTVKVSLSRVGLEPLHIRKGQRIAQIVVLPLPEFSVNQGNVSNIQTARGANGFGSTGG